MELLFFSLKETIKYLAMICILVNIFCTHIEYNHISSCMMTSSNGNIFRVTGPLCGELIGHRWIPPQKGQWRGSLMSLGSMSWIKGWENNREAGDLRCHRAHYDVTVMAFIYSAGVYLYSWRMMCNHMYIKAFDLGFGLLERKCHQWMLLWLGIGLMCGYIYTQQKKKRTCDSTGIFSGMEFIWPRQRYMTEISNLSEIKICLLICYCVRHVCAVDR